MCGCVFDCFFRRRHKQTKFYRRTTYERRAIYVLAHRFYALYINTGAPPSKTQLGRVNSRYNIIHPVGEVVGCSLEWLQLLFHSRAGKYIAYPRHCGKLSEVIEEKRFGLKRKHFSKTLDFIIHTIENLISFSWIKTKDFY